MTAEAFLFANGNAVYFHEDEEQMPELQKHGWKGIHKFLELYPNARVSVQGKTGIKKDLLANLLENIREIE